MSERSLRRDLIVVATIALAAACGKKGPKKPEADPAAVGKLASKMLRELPVPAAARDCTDADLTGGITLTWRAVTQLSGGKLASRPEDEAWINPPELDSPAVRTLIDNKDKTAARQAAAEVLAAPFLVAYKVDLVNAPMALGVKELKRGTVSTRVIRYDKSGLPVCVLVFHFQNDEKISDDAIAVSEKAAIDPAVAKILQDDLTAQWIKQAPRGKPAAATQP